MRFNNLCGSMASGSNVTMESFGPSFGQKYAACTDPEALDMSVLGRDILEMFALVVDRRTDLIAIIGGQHHYTIAVREAEF
ncbi:MAG: hypothetical protein ACR2RB_13305 [Gammaproteobacteria bacterium]